MRNRPSLTLLIPFLGLLVSDGNETCAQLNSWLLRSGSGEVRTVDFAGGNPLLGNLVPSFGLGGTEDVNLMTNAAGTPLFYTAVGSNNKVQVRTAGFALMPNGNGLIGNASSQCSAIAPRPCHGQQYYFIHHDGASHEHYYSIVDMALNGGQGDVTVKNKLIGSELGEGMAVSRQLENGCRWLFCYGIDGDVLYLKRALISQSGIGEPVTIGSAHAPNGTAWYSTLKLSPANDRLAISLPNALQPGAPDVVVWQLDAFSGTVSGAQQLALSSDPIVGIEFSPGGGFLYFVGNSALPDMEFGRFNLSTQAVEVIDPAIGSWVISVECAGNGRLYVGTSGFPRTLAEVRYPDASLLSAVGYDRNAVVFLSLGLMPTLPNAIEGEPPGSTSTPAYADFFVEELPGCDGHRFISKACLGSDLEWDFGDGWTDRREQPTHRYGVGTFDVTLSLTSCGQQVSITRPGLITVEGIQPVAGFETADSVCQHSAVQFTNTSELASAYRWWFGDGGASTAVDPSHIYHEHGMRTATLVAIEGCIVDTARKPVKVLPAAIASFHTNSDPCDERTYLVNTSVDGADWHWDFGDGDTVSHWRDPMHVYQQMGAFEVVLVSDPGTMCADTARATLLAGYGLIPVAWFVPNAFTPNQDGVNDVLRINGPEECASPVMTIHNKWGQLVWEGDSKEGWDGTVYGAIAPEGVYAYVLKGRLDDMKHGWFVLAR